MNSRLSPLIVLLLPPSTARRAAAADDVHKVFLAFIYLCMYTVTYYIIYLYDELSIEKKKKSEIRKKNIEMQRWLRRIRVLPHKFAFKPDWNLYDDCGAWC